MQDEPSFGTHDEARRIHRGLLQLDRELACLVSERELLPPVASYLESLTPCALWLSDACLDADGKLCGIEHSASWRAGQTHVVSPAHRVQRTLTEIDWPVPWIDSPCAPVLALELPAVAAWLRSLDLGPAAEPLHALILLPLYSAPHGRWQGLLAIGFAAPRAVSAHDELSLGCLQRAVSVALGHLRAERATRMILAEVSQVSALVDELSAAATTEAALESAVLPLISRGATAAFLVELEPGQAEAGSGSGSGARIAAGFDLDGPLPEVSVGTTCPAESLWLSAQWRTASGEPVSIEQIATDPRLDADTRQQLLTHRRGALVVLPLWSQQRLIGAIFCLWPTPQRFGEREQRLFRSIAHAAAMPIENRLLVSQMAARMRRDNQQRTLFQTTLDLLSVGVWIGPVDAGVPVFANRLAQEFVQETLPSAPLPAAAAGAPSPPAAPPPATSLREYLGNQTLADGQVHACELSLLRRDGERRSVDVHYTPLPNLDGRGRLMIACLVDITERQRAEQERQQKLRVIAAQAAALEERSTPLLPIARGIVVIPLIGTVDPERGQQLMQTAQAGVSSQRARILILDITGVTSIDSEAVRLISQTLSSVRLLGTTPIISGISAQTARLLVHMGADLLGAITLASLQSAITHALRLTGQVL